MCYSVEIAERRIIVNIYIYINKNCKAFHADTKNLENKKSFNEE